MNTTDLSSALITGAGGPPVVDVWNELFFHDDAVFLWDSTNLQWYRHAIPTSANSWETLGANSNLNNTPDAEYPAPPKYQHAGVYATMSSAGVAYIYGGDNDDSGQTILAAVYRFDAARPGWLAALWPAASAGQLPENSHFGGMYLAEKGGVGNQKSLFQGSMVV